VEYQERDDTTVFVKFPIISGRLKDKASIAIWTTTPWTLPRTSSLPCTRRKFTSSRNSPGL
jgi:isoleucyl-tRNA synthetase